MPRGPHRCAVGRAGPAAAEAAGAPGWPGPAVARPARCAERHSVDPLARAPRGTTCRSAIRRIRPVTGASSCGCARGRWSGRSAPWRRTSRPAAGWIFRNASSMAPLSSRKKGARGGPHQAGQGDQDHGRGRPRWSSSRRARGARFARRSHPRRRHPRPALRPGAPGAADRGQSL
jgi:hypothetical protein